MASSSSQVRAPLHQVSRKWVHPDGAHALLQLPDHEPRVELDDEDTPSLVQLDNQSQGSDRATAKLCGLVAHLLDDVVDEVWEVAEDARVAFACHSPDCDHAVARCAGLHVRDLRRPALRLVCDRFESRQAVVAKDLVAVIRC